MARSLWLASVLLMGAAVAAPRAQSALVAGTLSVRSATALPSSATVQVLLEDVSRAEVTPPVVAQLDLGRSTRFPVSFELPYDPAGIDPAHRYGVVARVVDGTTVLLTTRQPVLVVTQGHGNRADVSLVRAPGVRAAASRPNPTPSPDDARSAPLDRPLAPLPPATTLTGFPLTFAGTLTCTGCPAVRYQLNLFADDSFFLRTTPTGRADGAHDAVGSWVLSSDRRALVLQPDGGSPQVFDIRDRLTLRTLDVPAVDAAGPARGELRRTAFRPIDPRLTLSGEFQDDDGRAVFAECSTGKRLPVSGPGLSDLHAAAGRTTRQPPLVFASVEGRVVAGEGEPAAAEPAAPYLSVDRLVRAAPGERCQPRFASAPLEGTLWTLAQLTGQSSGASPALAEATLTFRADPRSFAAAAGCTRVAGGFDRSREEIRFTPAGALSACAADPSGGQAFLAMLRDARGYRVIGRTLQLFDASRHVLARFDAPPE